MKPNLGFIQFKMHKQEYSIKTDSLEKVNF